MDRPQMSRLGSAWVTLAARSQSRRSYRVEPTAGRLGAGIVIPVIDGMGPEHRATVDRHLFPAMEASIALRPGTFVDVGAHTGQTLVKLLALDLERPYLGFEPQPAAAAYVSELLLANEHPDGFVLAAAASSSSRALSLFSSGMLDDSASVVPGFRGTALYDRKRLVPALRGDDVLTELNDWDVAVIKIDAEGAEVDVLRGFEQAVDRDRPLVLCEVLPVGEGEVGEFRRRRADELLSLLADLDYRIMAIGRDGRVRATEVVGETRDFDSRDYAFVPAELAGPFGAAVGEAVPAA